MGVKIKADFSGWATKAGLKCSDGRTIQPNAFQHQSGEQVPLVWQHGHSDPENVLGHAILENREDGVYAYAFFNNTPKAEHARQLVEHGDIKSLSIWANQLVERMKHVLHGSIREVSLVLSGANPGAMIENVTIRHSDGDEENFEDEVIIYTGLPLEHSDMKDTEPPKEEDMKHADGNGEETVEDIYNTLTDKQKKVVEFMIGAAIESADGGMMEQSDIDDDDFNAIIESMNDLQKNVLHTLVNDALTHSDEEDNNDNNDDDKKGKEMKHNVFEDQGGESSASVLSHDDMKAIITSAEKQGSLKDAIQEYALQHNITDIDQLFPEAQLVGGSPSILARQMEWVQSLLGGVRKSPFSRIKTTAADLTHEDARAKGYIKGTLKKEEFITVSKRVTTPTTVYKKQKLDRDDVVDITDFDVISWLKSEMRIMLDEEIARAILVGDGRVIDDEDKINEQNIRPVATDHELFTTTINVNIDNANSSAVEIIDALIRNRKFYRGSGLPTFYTSETYIAEFLLLKDTLGRRLYNSLADVAVDLRVKEIVGCEVLEEYDDIVGIMFNPIDYTAGADAGGQVSMFDDFDIDYNQHKYLIETRMSGALTRIKSAMVVNKVASATTLVTPNAPTFNGDTGVVTIPSQTGVVYQDASDDSVLSAGAQAALDVGESLTVNAVPDTGYAFNTSEDDTWTFTMD